MFSKMFKDQHTVGIIGQGYAGMHALVVEMLLHEPEHVVVICKLEDVEQIRNVSDNNKTFLIFADPFGKDQFDESIIALNKLKEEVFLQKNFDELLVLETEQGIKRKDLARVVKYCGGFDKTIHKVKENTEKFFKIPPPVP